MLDLVLYEDGKEIYRKENQDLVLMYTDTSEDWYIKGGGTVGDLIRLSADSLLFLYDTLKSNDDSINELEYLHAVVNLFLDVLHNEKSTDTILKCSNPKYLPKAIELSVKLYEEFKKKLPNGIKFTGIDYDELLKQLGEEDENN